MAPRREDLGSWLEGTPGGGPGDGASAPVDRVRAAPLGRRVLALGVDWFASMAVTSLFWRDPGGSGIFAADPWATLGVFAVSTTVFVGVLGHTIGHRLLGLRVVPLAPGSADGRHPVDAAPGLRAAAVRTLLACLVVPAVVWDGSGRGLHDLAARTAVVRRDTAPDGATRADA